MSKKSKALIIVTTALFLALVGRVGYFLAYYRIVKVPTGQWPILLFRATACFCESVRRDKARRYCALQTARRP